MVLIEVFRVNVTTSPLLGVTEAALLPSVPVVPSDKVPQLAEDPSCVLAVAGDGVAPVNKLVPDGNT